MILVQRYEIRRTAVALKNPIGERVGTKSRPPPAWEVRWRRAEWPKNRAPNTGAC